MTDPRLYILMRTDMDSMNAGKAMAQAAHAATAFTARMDQIVRADEPFISPVCSAYMEWKAATHQGFGTTIVLEAPNKKVLMDQIEMAKLFSYVADVVYDPSYHVRDGETTHLIPVDTCGYIFSPEEPPRYLRELGLHP